MLHVRKVKNTTCIEQGQRSVSRRSFSSNQTNLSDYYISVIAPYFASISVEHQEVFYFPNVQAYIPVLCFAQDNGNPTVADAGLKAEVVAQGLDFLLGWHFLGPH